MTEASRESMDSKLLHMGNYSQQIALHRQTHTYRAFPIIILGEGELFQGLLILQNSSNST